MQPSFAKCFLLNVAMLSAPWAAALAAMYESAKSEFVSRASATAASTSYSSVTVMFGKASTASIMSRISPRATL